MLHFSLRADAEGIALPQTDFGKMHILRHPSRKFFHCARQDAIGPKAVIQAGAGVFHIALLGTPNREKPLHRVLLHISVFLRVEKPLGKPQRPLICLRGAFIMEALVGLQVDTDGAGRQRHDAIASAMGHGHIQLRQIRKIGFSPGGSADPQIPFRPSLSPRSAIMPGSLPHPYIGRALIRREYIQTDRFPGLITHWCSPYPSYIPQHP